MGQVRDGGVSRGQTIEVERLEVVGFRSDRHAVAARIEPGEKVQTVSAGRLRVDLQARRGIEKRHRPTHEAGFAHVLNSIPVLVEPDPVTDRTRSGRAVDVSKVHIAAVLTHGQRGGRHMGGCKAIEIVGLGVVRLRRHDHAVTARRESVEEVDAIHPSPLGLANLGPCGIEQRDGPAFETHFTVILNAIPIAVVPDAITNGPKGNVDIAEVHIASILTGSKLRNRDMCRGDAVQVKGLIVLRARCHRHSVGAGRERAEQVGAIGTGILLIHEHVAGPVEHLEDHVPTHQTGFGYVLIALRVFVEPHAVTDRTQGILRRRLVLVDDRGLGTRRSNGLEGVVARSGIVAGCDRADGNGNCAQTHKVGHIINTDDISGRHGGRTALLGIHGARRTSEINGTVEDLELVEETDAGRDNHEVQGWAGSSERHVRPGGDCPPDIIPVLNLCDRLVCSGQAEFNGKQRPKTSVEFRKRNDPGPVGERLRHHGRVRHKIRLCDAAEHRR